MVTACQRPRVAAGRGDDLDLRLVFIRIEVGAGFDIRQTLAVRRKMRIPEFHDAREIRHRGNSPVAPRGSERQDPKGGRCRNNTQDHTHPSGDSAPDYIPGALPAMR
jgi:hypothetical protein